MFGYNLVPDMTTCEGWSQPGASGTSYFCLDSFLNTTQQMTTACDAVSFSNKL